MKIKEIEWTLEPSVRYPGAVFMVGKVSGKVLFTAGAVMQDGSGGFDMICFLQDKQFRRVANMDAVKLGAKEMLEKHLSDLVEP